jgi:serine protease AprX
MKRLVSAVIFVSFLINSGFAGVSFVRSSGITFTGADGITFTGADGITLTGADGLLNYTTNGISLVGLDGITLTGADSQRSVGPNGTTFIGPNGITLTGADGITLTGADGLNLTGLDGITLTGADGVRYAADSILVRRPNGITLTGADGTNIIGADGITLTGADGITLTGADGITLTGADGITLTGADSIVGFSPTGVLFNIANPNGITLTGADGITLTGADGINVLGADGITFTGADGLAVTGLNEGHIGIQGLDPELATLLNNLTDDSGVNAVIVYHKAVTDADLAQLRQVGILGGTRFRRLPMVQVIATRPQIAAISRSPNVRSIYGNRTLTFNSDPYFNSTQVQRVSGDSDLRTENNGLPVTGRNVTVAVLDTGVNGLHPDLLGRVVQNVKLLDLQGLPVGFTNPLPLENLPTTDLVMGHGTFVSGIIAGSGASSSGKYAGIATGAKLLGMSAGDVDLTNILSGFDYLLDKGAKYKVRVVNCSFSAQTVYDPNDPVNVATKMLTDAGVNVVFSAGNTGPGNGTLNPYAAAPWVISVGATDNQGRLADFSSRGYFAEPNQHPTLVAPGVNIASLRSPTGVTGLSGLLGADASRLNFWESIFYTTASGTSFSAPQVSAAIALMLEANPNLKPAEIKEILSRTATPMPRYFYHEAGAGMLNTYAAVLQAAFPERRIGMFRSVLSQNQIKFTTSASQAFTAPVVPGLVTSINVPVPPNTVQAGITVGWGLSANDFGLKLFDSSNALVGESNYLNLLSFTGRRESVSLRSPRPQTFHAAVQHTLGIGTSQNVSGAVELTQVQYPSLVDLSSLTSNDLTQANISLLSNAMLPEGRRFRPFAAVSRADLAAAFVRAGEVPQYLAANPIFADVPDMTTRNAVESVQTNPAGKLFYDVNVGRFKPDDPASRLVAAVAFVRAAGLTSKAATTNLPAGIADATSIPAEWRGTVAVALKYGFMTLDGNRFTPARAITRIELARALNALFSQ